MSGDIADDLEKLNLKKQGSLSINVAADSSNDATPPPVERGSSKACTWE
eukprot:CAMPEP_0113915270 /NCGR_PEP_ID=MMETSP0780_2-20120614/31087_1 /TAXON_ID=652834 /ORGANISM="Palpitomonas bilix" /LENGTH=48 /DNA_ID=CAMNT_0000913717 /DNA_START=138 /DNA_END=284 /DNA_ORIENTATION=+ /assembly_acc=CAM_ASM_000599